MIRRAARKAAELRTFRFATAERSICGSQKRRTQVLNAATIGRPIFLVVGLGPDRSAIFLPASARK
jgi:hypothetical protein